MIGPLAGVSVLVTRPPHQAGVLVEKIRAAGGIPILFPVLEIRDISDQRPLLELIGRLDEFDMAIFVSPNAVNKAMNLITANRTIPSRLRLATVGPGTVASLQRFGVNSVIAPTTRFDSEALLDMAELKEIAGKRVVIFRGDGGRDLLGQTLLERGAKLEYAECYRRVKPNADVSPLLEALARGELKAVTITSSEGLRNLLDMVGKADQFRLEKIPLLVSHERIAKAAKKMGWLHVILTSPGDDGFLEGLSNYFRPRVAGGNSP